MISGMQPSFIAWLKSAPSAAQQLGALELALLARHEQRRGAFSICLVDRRASLEEQPDDFGVAL